MSDESSLSFTFKKSKSAVVLFTSQAIYLSKSLLSSLMFYRVNKLCDYWAMMMEDVENNQSDSKL